LAAASRAFVVRLGQHDVHETTSASSHHQLKNIVITISCSSSFNMSTSSYSLNITLAAAFRLMMMMIWSSYYSYCSNRVVTAQTKSSPKNKEPHEFET
jgi:hypothetical protein